MAGNPPLTHVLARLAEDWHRCHRRLELTSHANDDTQEVADDAFYLHPFPDFCARICTFTGLDRDELHRAATVAFNAKPEIVAALLPWEGERALLDLYSALQSQHPAIAKKCGLPATKDTILRWRRNPFYHATEHLPNDDVRRTGTFSTNPAVLQQLGTPFKLPTVIPDDSDLLILKLHYPDADPAEPPWQDIKADLLAGGVSLHTVHHATSLDLLRMLVRVRKPPSPASKQDVSLDDATMATAKAMQAYLQSLASANTTVQSMLVQSPNDPRVTILTDPEERQRESANRAKLFPGGVPTNANIVDLVVRLDAAKGSGKSQREIALEFMCGDRKKAFSLLSQIRRLKREGRINL